MEVKPVILMLLSWICLAMAIVIGVSAGLGKDWDSKSRGIVAAVLADIAHFSQQLLQTHRAPLRYWLLGGLLLVGAIPGHAFDLMVDPNWYAPNERCDSVMIPIMGLMGLLPTWALLVGLATLAIALLTSLGLPQPVPVYSLRLGPWWFNMAVSALTLALAALPAYIVGDYLVALLVPRMLSGDCQGAQALVEIHRRGPVVQLLPWISAAVLLWLLHMRALALAPRGWQKRVAKDRNG